MKFQAIHHLKSYSIFINYWRVQSCLGLLYVSLLTSRFNCCSSPGEHKVNTIINLLFKTVNMIPFDPWSVSSNQMHLSHSQFSYRTWRSAILKLSVFWGSSERKVANKRWEKSDSYRVLRIIKLMLEPLFLSSILWHERILKSCCLRETV